MSKETESSQKRAGPRVKAAIHVEVEVAGEKRKVKLLSRDIGTGGVYLRTTNPAPLWKRVRMVLESPEGQPLEITGEVVRSVPPEKAKQSKYPPGMAIAFDESSRAKRKQLVELVLELCARQQTEERKPPSTQQREAPAGNGDREKSAVKPDNVLEEIDSLLDDLAQETDTKAGAASPETEEEELELKLPEDDLENPAVEEAGGQTSEQQDSDRVVEEAAKMLRQRLEAYRRSLGGDTHYHVLCLGLDATADQIEKGFRKLIAELTPQVPAERLPADLQQQLKTVLNRIRKAYAILSKPERKRAYDFLLDNLVEDQL